MKLSTSSNVIGSRMRPAHRALTVAVAALAGLGMSLMASSPAAGAATGSSVGYVRLAHLSPDTPAVDVYLAKIGDSSFAPQVFPHVGYGVMSSYLPLPTGTYAVSMRQQGAP